MDTREFVSRWNAATEEHLVHQMRSVLAGLASRGVLPTLSDEQSARLAPMLVHAFQLAAAREGGPHVATQYLSELASDSGERSS
jgi:hypothetical protein